MFKKQLLAFLLAVTFALPVYAQSVQQSGSVTNGHVPVWLSNGVIRDGGTAANGNLTSLGVRATGSGICQNSDLITAAGYQQICLGVTTAGGGYLSVQNLGTATAQSFSLIINGTTTTFPTGGSTIATITTPLVSGDLICASGTAGLLADCNVKPWTTAGTNGQLLIGQTAAAPAFTSLSGDSTLTAGGVMVNTKLNGVSYGTSPSTNTVPVVTSANTVTYQTVNVAAGGTGAVTLTNHGVVLGQGTSAFVATTAGTSGQCLLSGGASADPNWGACASGAGSAAGSNTQVQFNNSTALGGSANLTWVSPILTIGVNGTTTGQLNLANGSGGGAAVTLQNVTATSSWNFNFPINAGTSGFLLASGGGGSTPNTWINSGLTIGGVSCNIGTSCSLAVGNLSAIAAGTVVGNNTTSSTIPSASTAPVIGVPGTTAGSLGIANGSGGGATITVQNQGATVAYNFNLPTTAGTSNQVFTSASGGTSSNTWTNIADLVTAGTNITKAGTTSVTINVAAPFNPTTLTNHGVLIGQATSSIVALAAAGAGTILQGVASSDPAFSATPTLGLAATATGKLNLAGTTSGTVTIQPQDAAGTYNFNLPTSAGTSGQALLSAGGGALPMTFGTLGVAAGGTGVATLTNHGVLLGQGTSAVVVTSAGTTGQCLLSGGASADPNWASCASGSGSAGGSDTQVQYNNATTLAGSASFTWVSPALTIGAAGSTTGILKLTGATSGTISIQGQAAAGTFNYNLPTSAGTSGQPLLSGGGGAAAMTFGTLGVAAGGTGLTSGTSGGVPYYSASGTLASSGALGANQIVLGGGAGATPTSLTCATATTVVHGGTPPTCTAVSLTADVTGTLPLANGGTAQTTALAARGSSGLNIDQMTTHGDSNYTIVSTDRSVATSATLTATRTWTLPAANAVNAGQYLWVTDMVGGASSGNPITISRAGADTINGTTSTSIAAAYGGALLISDGSSKWSFYPQSATGGGTVTSVATSNGLVGGTITTSGTLKNAVPVFQGRLTLATGVWVMTTSQSAKTTVFYTFVNAGRYITTYDGTNSTVTDVGAEVSIVLGSNWAANSNFDVYFGYDSGTLRICTGPAWTSATGRGTGAGTTEIDYTTTGYPTNKVSMTCRYNNTTTFTCAAAQCSYVGSFRTNGSTGTVDWTLGGSSAGGTAGSLNVWNQYNQELVNTVVSDSTSSWTYSPGGSPAWRSKDNSTGNRVTFLSGQAQKVFTARSTIGFITSATTSFSWIGIGLNVTNANSAVTGWGAITAGGVAPTSEYSVTTLGQNFFQGLEYCTASTTCTYYGTAAPTIDGLMFYGWM